MFHNKRSHHNEKPTHHNKSSPCSSQLAKSSCINKDSAQPKIINKWNCFLKIKFSGLPWWLSGKESICLPMQRMWVWSLVQEDCTSVEQLSLWATTAEPTHCNYWSLCSPRAHGAQQEQPPQQEAHIPTTKSSPCSPQLEKAHMQQQRPSAEKNT